jgi:ribose transport system ATP-binding protein/rhamnose transport system ATP-binding protein
VRSGEIVGFAGLIGAGRTEFARAVFGLSPVHAGSLSIDGRPVTSRSPMSGIRNGIAYVPEDRRLLGIVPPLTVRENWSLSSLGRLSTVGVVKRGAERREAAAAVRQLQVSPPSIEGRIDALSGGNQQKVVLGRWLATAPRLLILDEPTRGVDVGAKAEIHRIVGEFAKAGVAILLISSELPEIIATSDRIYVFHEGTIAGEFSQAEATETAIMTRATGAREAAHV